MMPKAPTKTVTSLVSKGDVVRPLPFSGDDRALVAALLAEHPGAMEALYDRYVNYMERVLARIISTDVDLPELIQDIFVQAFTSIRKLRRPERLRPWLASIAVFTARKQLKRRRLGERICPADSERAPEVRIRHADMESREALRSVYEVLDGLPTDERIVFVLRYIEEMELKEAADACRISLATVKRRLRRANEKFGDAAGQHPQLRYWMRRGKRWEVT